MSAQEPILIPVDPIVAHIDQVWQDGFKFDSHDICAVYERPLRLTISTKDELEFNEALKTTDALANSESGPDESPTCTLTADDGRWTVELVIANGHLGVAWTAHSTPLQHDQIPRLGTCLVELFCGDYQDGVDEMNYDLKIAGYELRYVAREFCHLETIQRNDIFLKEGYIVVNFGINERRTSSDASFLAEPSTYLAVVMKGLETNIESSPPNVVVKLRDGTIKVDEKLLRNVKHFRNMFDGGYSESCIKEPLTRASDSEMESPVQEQPDSAEEAVPDDTVAMDSEEAATSETDSDYDEDEHKARQNAVPVQIKRVNADQFSMATFKAFAAYLSTGSIGFKQLSSAERGTPLPNAIAVNQVLPNSYHCSCKSLYTLADYYTMPKLRNYCLTTFSQLLTPSNALKELALRFARQHAAVATAIEAYLLEHWAKVSVSDTFEDDMRKAMEYEESRGVLMRVLKKMTPV